MIKKTALAAMVGLLCLPVLASSTLYNLQLNGFPASTYSGAAQIGSVGDVWNNPDWTGVPTGSTTLFSGISLVDSSGGDNGVSITMTAAYNNNTSAWNDGGVFNHYTGQTAGSATPVLMDQLVKVDYSGSVNVMTLSFSGLPAGYAATVYVYGSGTASGRGSSWALDAANGGDTAAIDYDGSATGRNVTLASSQGTGWEVLAGTVDGSGNLVVTASAGPGSTWWQTYMNGLQLDVAPPPATAPGITNLNDVTAVVGDNVTLVPTITGSPTPTFQWWENGSEMVGETNATLTLSNVQTNQSGNVYSLVAVNSEGATTNSMTLTVLDPLPAFPGADGAARYASGGRGGIVYHVTKLDQNYSDNVAGTLRYGLDDANFPTGMPRTIVFDVAGVFWLGRYGAEKGHDNGWDTQSRYYIGSNVTLAGQTAPGPVIVMGGVTKVTKTNVIVRNVTFAAGYGMRNFEKPEDGILPTPGTFPDAYTYDAVDISGQQIMIDHCTTIDATDETISCNEMAADLTIQYCNISQGQNYPQADAENPGTYTGHALGSLWQAGSDAKVSVLNNLYAHQKGRVPRVGSEVGTGALNDFRNNVFYNWNSTAGTGAAGQPSFNNFINNFYLSGPGGDDVSGTNVTYGNVGGTGIFNGISASDTRVYCNGNLMDTNNDGDPYDTASADASYSSSSLQASAYDIDIGLTLDSQAAFTNVLRYLGARWWARDYDFTLGNTNAISTNDIAAYVDERLIHETFTGTGKIRAWADDPFDNDPNEGFEWRALLALRADTNSAAAPFNRPAGWDTDADGMPDAWESEHGLDVNVANNNGDFDHDGYTDLEEYLNDVAAWPAPGVINFTGASNTRYAQIANWLVSGVSIDITGRGMVTTASRWQPSRYDTVLISNRTCLVDAVGQHAGALLLATNAALNVTNGWLKVADRIEIGSNCTVAVQSSGALLVTNSIVNNGTLRLTDSAGLTVGGSITNNGVLDMMTWSGTLPTIVNNGIILDYSLVQVDSISVDGADLIVTIQGYTGHNYQLQYCDSLLSGTWVNTGSSVTGNNAPVELKHVGGAAAQQRMYRVSVSP